MEFIAIKKEPSRSYIETFFLLHPQRHVKRRCLKLLIEDDTSHTMLTTAEAMSKTHRLAFAPVQNFQALGWPCGSYTLHVMHWSIHMYFCSRACSQSCNEFSLICKQLPIKKHALPEGGGHHDQYSEELGLRNSHRGPAQQGQCTVDHVFFPSTTRSDPSRNSGEMVVRGLPNRV